MLLVRGGCAEVSYTAKVWSSLRRDFCRELGLGDVRIFLTCRATWAMCGDPVHGDDSETYTQQILKWCKFADMLVIELLR